MRASPLLFAPLLLLACNTVVTITSGRLMRPIPQPESP
jgi:hypothetical protein